MIGQRLTKREKPVIQLTLMGAVKLPGENKFIRGNGASLATMLLR